MSQFTARLSAPTSYLPPSGGAQVDNGTGNNQTSLGNIQRIVVHHTAGSTMEGAVQWHRNSPPNGLGWWAVGYHFCVGRERVHPPANRSEVGVYFGRPLANQGAHGGTNGNRNSIGIAAVGNFGNTNPPHLAFIQRELTHLITDCLISFPRQGSNGINRVNRIGAISQPVTQANAEISGIMRHADVDPVNNSGCPGTHLGVNAIINNAIHMANTFDAAERLRLMPQIGGNSALPINIARSANGLNAGQENLGTFIIRLDAIRNSMSSGVQSQIGGIDQATRNLFNLGVIRTEAARIAIVNGHASVLGLNSLIFNAASHLPTVMQWIAEIPFKAPHEDLLHDEAIEQREYTAHDVELAYDDSFTQFEEQT